MTALHLALALAGCVAIAGAVRFVALRLTALGVALDDSYDPDDRSGP